MQRSDKGDSMALDHAQAAKEILEAVGGPGNIVSAAHCATRLRLVIADDSKVDQEKVDDAVGAKGNFKASGQLQVIYGTGTVNKVYESASRATSPPRARPTSRRRPPSSRTAS